MAQSYSALTVAPFRLEAESFDLLKGYSIQSIGPASAGAALRTTGSGQHSAAHAFTGDAGVYDIDLGYFDENDGIASLSLIINGHQVDHFLFDRNLGSPNANARTATEHVVSGVEIRPGDLIELIGVSDRGEAARVDYLDFHKVAELPATGLRVEAESFHRTGYAVKSLGLASAGAVLQTSGSGQHTASHTFTGSAGTYDIDLGYFDENDGAASLSVRVNGHEVDHFVFDRNLGSPNANTRTATERTISHVQLNPGDLIELVGNPNGGEPGRIDYLDFHATAAAASTPDAIYRSGDELKIRIGDGHGGFGAEQATGIHGIGSYGVADLTGDGFADIAGFDSATLTLRTFANDGHGAFSQIASLAIPPEQDTELDWPDLADVDGDGDIDVVARVGYLSVRVYENDGAGHFSLGQKVFAEGTEGNSVRLADVSGDGRPDLFFGDSSGLALGYATNDGTGSFGAPFKTYGWADNSASMDFGDFDGDGDIDWVTTGEEDAGAVYLFRNQAGTGTVSQTFEYDDVPGQPSYYPTDAIVGDIDGDDDLDIAASVTVYDGPTTADTLLLVNDGTGHFAGLDGGRNKHFADLDADGDLDIVGLSTAGLRVLSNDGEGSFTFAGLTAAASPVDLIVSNLDEALPSGSLASIIGDFEIA